METFFGRRARATPLTPVQRDLVIGALLGDGYLMPTSAGCCFRVSHGLTQRSYADWKFARLSSYIRTPPRQCGTTYYFRTVTHPEFGGLRQAFYADGRKKRVPVRLLEQELTAFGLAVWFMDDGCRDGKQVRLNTQSFSIDENDLLVTFLARRFGVEAHLNRDKDRWRLRLRERTVARFVELVQPHVTTDLRYKLPL